ncbi:hypothetical protein LUZ60_005787 [Juncus effusus]|nr:hypothetical protein LUZ60_005787 [Juncus effusus]
MTECAIKLFGKRIPLQSVGEEERDDDQKANSTNSPSQDDKLPKDPSTPLQSENPKPSPNQEDLLEDSSNNSDSKTPLKKPDKILPCPRCNSTETKFCYYNNYNVNQPRHFCKNCQRYWTAGGSMRNVPVGAGRRKSKTNFNSLNGTHFYPNLPVSPISSKNNGLVLSFGSDREEISSISSLEGSRCNKEEEKSKSSNNFEGSNCVNGANNSMPYMWGPVPVPVQFYPYWGCVPVPCNNNNYYYNYNNNGWNNNSVGWSSGVCTGSGNSTLGKHSRDETIAPNCGVENCTKEMKTNNNIWVPKTLRIDNPEEAAKSSIWAMVHQSEKSEKFGGKIAKMFGGNKDERKENNSSVLLSSNPAAFARSANFRESAN